MLSCTMIVTLLLLLPLVGAEWNKECNSCVLGKDSTNADKIQQRGFTSLDGEGTTEKINIEQAKANGVILSTGKVCTTPCKPYWRYRVHGCVGEDAGWHQTCAPYNKDQYGRKCERVEKGSWISGPYCYVENGNSYWLHNGGSWGYTHYPICVSDHSMCTDIMEWDQD